MSHFHGRTEEKSRVSIGRDAESFVAEYLEKQGFQIVDRNVRVGSLEIDLILYKDRTTIFCEVRYRKDTKYGHPAETICWQKQKRIRSAALAWLKRQAFRSSYIRFDIAALTKSPQGYLDLTYYENAF